MSNQYLNFLKRLYDELQNAGIITKRVSSAKEKVQTVLDYGEKLKKVQSKVLERKEYLRRIKALYYKKYIIKESDIPNDYFEHLSEMYLAEGHGHFDLVNPTGYSEKEERELHVKQIIDAQKASLDTWLDYLMSSDSDYIDMIYKIWAFQGMLSIGTLNKKLDGYNRRRKNTIAPFVNLNSEILGKSVLYLKMYLKEEAEDYPDEETKRLASSESFYQIYGKLLAKEKTIKKNGDEGIWVKYNYKREEEALKLYNDLQGYNTGWCTASDKKTAINQVCGGGAYLGGDFYVYYSKDENNEYKIPRIAIRMERDKIGEIRGVASNQNIEPSLTDILDEKLKEFPDSKEYMKKVRDMKRLTGIYKKHQLKEELTKEDLRFLYEVDDIVDGFGYRKDARMEEIKRTRNLKKDLAFALGCPEEGIVSDKEKIRENTVCYVGELLENIKFPRYVYGSIVLDFKESEEVLLPEVVIGSLSLSRNTLKVKNLRLPRIVRTFYYYSNSFPENVILPEIIDGEFFATSITLEKMLIVKLPSVVRLGIYLSDYVLSLEELKTYKKYAMEELTVEELKSLYGIDCKSYFEEYNVDFKIRDTIMSFRNKRKDLAKVFSSFESDIVLGSNGLFYSMQMHYCKCFYGDIFIMEDKVRAGFLLPEYVIGNLKFVNLSSTDGLVFPKMVTADIYMNRLEVDDLLELELPTNVKEIHLSDGKYSLEELKEIIAIKKERQNLEVKKSDIQKLGEDNLKRGNISVWYILIPAFTLLLGVIIASIIYKI